MSRIQAIAPEQATGKAKELYEGIEKKLGKVPNVFRHMANSPAVLEAYLGFSGALSTGVLEPKVREMIAITIAEINSCEYCLSAHVAIGKSVGMKDDEISLAREQRAQDPKVNAILKFVRHVVLSRAEVTDSEVEALKAAGCNDAEIAEIIANVGLNLFTNYFNHVVKPEVDFPKVPAAFPA